MQEVFEYNKLKRLSIYSVAGLAEQKDKAKLLVFENMTPEELLGMICEFFHVTHEQITGPNKKRELIVARHIFCYIAKHRLHLTLNAVGELLGGRDHKTIICACRKVRDFLDNEDPVMCKAFNRFIKYCEPMTIRTFADG